MERCHVTISPPKSYDSVRTIALPSIARESALYLRDTQNHFVWQSPAEDKPVNPSTFRKLYRECLESIPGIRYLPSHNCRHSYVSLLVAEHVELPIAQALVGHSTQLMTMHYTHVLPAVKKDAAEKLSSLFIK
jgi:integrase